MLTSITLAATLALAGQVPADETPRPKTEARKAADEIKPLPPRAIPDDPPPHEGALVDIPHVIEPPDLIVVELLEALPGRPVTGERLVKPDGKIALGFYGEVHVRGLTVEQAKVKIIHHLRDFMTGETLGLIRAEVESGPPGPLPTPGTKTRIDRPAPLEERPLIPPPAADPAGKPATIPKPDPNRSPSDLSPTPPGPSARSSRPAPTLARITTRRAQEPAMPAKAREGEGGETFMVAIAPAESIRVFVDITSFNTQVYYVQGDVGTPGRLPVTGKETILDALNYAGGLASTAEPQDIHLYRPARGGKPAKDYKIDLAAIHKGDARANLQIFPNDRLIVGRDATVQKTIELDRAASPLNSVFNSLLQQSFTARSLGAAAGEMNGTTQARREAMVKEWADFLWSVSSKEGGAPLDEKAFREAVMKRLAPAPEPKK